MAGNPWKKVARGMARRIPAQAYNAFLEAGLRDRDRLLVQRPEVEEHFRSSTIIKVLNDSGGDRDVGDILGLAEPLYGPDEQLSEFLHRTAFRGVLPQLEHTGRFAVLIEPATQGGVARAVVSGIAVCRLDLAGREMLDKADVLPGNAAALGPAADGSAQVLWADEGPGPVWAVVRLAAGGWPALAVVEVLYRVDALASDLCASGSGSAPIRGECPSWLHIGRLVHYDAACDVWRPGRCVWIVDAQRQSLLTGRRYFAALAALTPPEHLIAPPLPADGPCSQASDLANAAVYVTAVEASAVLKILELAGCCNTGQELSGSGMGLEPLCEPTQYRIYRAAVLRYDPQRCEWLEEPGDVYAADKCGRVLPNDYKLLGTFGGVIPEVSAGCGSGSGAGPPTGRCFALYWVECAGYTGSRTVVREVTCRGGRLYVRRAEETWICGHLHRSKDEETEYQAGCCDCDGGGGGPPGGGSGGGTDCCCNVPLPAQVEIEFTSGCLAGQRYTLSRINDCPSPAYQGSGQFGDCTFQIHFACTSGTNLFNLSLSGSLAGNGGGGFVTCDPFEVVDGIISYTSYCMSCTSGTMRFNVIGL